MVKQIEQNRLYLRKVCGSDVTTGEHARLNAELKHEFPGANYLIFALNGTLIAKQPAEEHKERFKKVLADYNLVH